MASRSHVHCHWAPTLFLCPRSGLWFSQHCPVGFFSPYIYVRYYPRYWPTPIDLGGTWHLLLLYVQVSGSLWGQIRQCAKFWGCTPPMQRRIGASFRSPVQGHWYNRYNVLLLIILPYLLLWSCIIISMFNIYIKNVVLLLLLNSRNMWDTSYPSEKKNKCNIIIHWSIISSSP